MAWLAANLADLPGTGIVDCLTRREVDNPDETFRLGACSRSICERVPSQSAGTENPRDQRLQTGIEGHLPRIGGRDGERPGRLPGQVRDSSENDDRHDRHHR